MDDSSFGTRLRQQRQQRGASLEDVSASTRISVRLLEAFENERWDRLPGGIFNRGFLRAIARFLKIDEDALIAAYVAATNDSPERRAPERRSAVEAIAYPLDLGRCPAPRCRYRRRRLSGLPQVPSARAARFQRAPRAIFRHHGHTPPLAPEHRRNAKVRVANTGPQVFPAIEKTRALP